MCSGRDEKFVRQMALKREKLVILQQICHLDRSEAQWRDLRFSLLSSHTGSRVQHIYGPTKEAAEKLMLSKRTGFSRSFFSGLDVRANARCGEAARTLPIRPKSRALIPCQRNSSINFRDRTLASPMLASQQRNRAKTSQAPEQPSPADRRYQKAQLPSLTTVAGLSCAEAGWSRREHFRCWF